MFKLSLLVGISLALNGIRISKMNNGNFSLSVYLVGAIYIVLQDATRVAMHIYRKQWFNICMRFDFMGVLQQPNQFVFDWYDCLQIVLFGLIMKLV